MGSSGLHWSNGVAIMDIQLELVGIIENIQIVGHMILVLLHWMFILNIVQMVVMEMYAHRQILKEKENDNEHSRCRRRLFNRI